MSRYVTAGSAAPERVAAADEEAARARRRGWRARPPRRARILAGELAVVVEVEGDVVEARADEAAEQPQLGGLEQAARDRGRAAGVAMGEPEARAPWRVAMRMPYQRKRRGGPAARRWRPASGTYRVPYTAGPRALSNTTRAFLAKFVDTLANRFGIIKSNDARTSFTIHRTKEPRVPGQQVANASVARARPQRRSRRQVRPGVLLASSRSSAGRSSSRSGGSSGRSGASRMRFRQIFREGAPLLGGLRGGQEAPRRARSPSSTSAAGQELVDRLRRRGDGGRTRSTTRTKGCPSSALDAAHRAMRRAGVDRGRAHGALPALPRHHGQRRARSSASSARCGAS